MSKDGTKLELKNEFAFLELTVVYDANGPRLQITDRLRGSVRYFDPLQVECMLRWIRSCWIGTCRIE